MYERSIFPRLSETQRSILLLGPRQVGKSTLLASLKPDLSINLASPAIFRDYVAQPERLEFELRVAGSQTRTIFIDDRSGLKGLRSFAERATRVRRSIVVFLGPRKHQLEEVEVLPVSDFLGELPSR